MGNLILFLIHRFMAVDKKTGWQEYGDARLVEQPRPLNC